MANTTDNKAHVEALLKKAAESGDSGDAMRFSQAALNAANAMCSLSVVERGGK